MSIIVILIIPNYNHNLLVINSKNKRDLALGTQWLKGLSSTKPILSQINKANFQMATVTYFYSYIGFSAQVLHRQKTEGKHSNSLKVASFFFFPPFFFNT